MIKGNGTGKLFVVYVRKSGEAPWTYLKGGFSSRDKANAWLEQKVMGL